MKKSKIPLPIWVVGLIIVISLNHVKLKNEDTKIIAAIENGKLVEIYEENAESQKERNEGNIYLGIVKDIVPGMQAAFIDIGTEKNSFIHVKDVVPQVDEKVEKRIIPNIKEVVKPNQKMLIQIQM